MPKKPKPPKVPVYDYTDDVVPDKPMAVIPPDDPVYGSDGKLLGKGPSAVPSFGDPKPGGGSYHGGVRVLGKDMKSKIVAHQREPEDQEPAILDRRTAKINKILRGW